MRVRYAMKRELGTVRPHHHLSEAARLMAENACGWLPVVDVSGRVVGVITDRDVCMAAYTRGRALDDIAVEGAMTTNVHSIHLEDRLEDALAAMRNYRVRRMPVVDDEGVLCGMLSITDLTRRAASSSGVQPDDIVTTLAAIGEARSAEPYA